LTEEIPDKNLFMMCTTLNKPAANELPPGYYFRLCRKDELDIWKAMQFDTVELAQEYYDFMTDYFNKVYLTENDLFFDRCVFVCDEHDDPIGTCFLWKSYSQIWTLHWLKVLSPHEGKGIGRALISYVMESLPEKEYPVFLHTHPSSYRAIKLYADLGFEIITDPIIGSRTNDLSECIEILQKHMPISHLKKLKFAQAPHNFLEAVKSSEVEEF
jgi:ribosomal protein S18 acetylase RimI-like enzyme